MDGCAHGTCIFYRLSPRSITNCTSPEDQVVLVAAPREKSQVTIPTSTLVVDSLAVQSAAASWILFKDAIFAASALPSTPGSTAEESEPQEQPRTTEAIPACGMEPQPPTICASMKSYANVLDLFDDPAHQTSSPLLAPHSTRTYTCNICHPEDNTLEKIIKDLGGKPPSFDNFVTCSFSTESYRQFSGHVTTHFKGYSARGLEQTTMMCTWPGCQSLPLKPRGMRSHTLACHIATFICPFSGCRWKNGGNKVTYLKEHIKERHNVNIATLDPRLFVVPFNSIVLSL